MAATPRKSIKMFPLTAAKPMKPTAGLPRATPLKSPATTPKTPGSIPGFKGGAGRPATTDRYDIRQTPEQKTGFEVLNTEPAVIASAKTKFFGLPAGFAPQGLGKPPAIGSGPKGTGGMPRPLAKLREKHISSGMNNQRSYHK